MEQEARIWLIPAYRKVVKRMRYKNGLKIRVARERRGWTLAQLAEKVGKSAPYLSDIERGNRRGSYATLEVIARVLELPVEEIWEVA